MRPEGALMRIHTHLDWGALARFYMLDTRQYRSWQACPRKGRRGGSNTIDIEHCPRLPVPGRSMLGRAQERWLEHVLGDSPAAWNLVAQTTPMAQFDTKPGPGRRAWTDGWDGFPAARQRFLDFVSSRKVANPVVLVVPKSGVFSSTTRSLMAAGQAERARRQATRGTTMPSSAGRKSSAVSVTAGPGS